MAVIIMKIAHFNCGIRGIATYAINIYDYFQPRGWDQLVISEAPWTKRDIGAFQPGPHLLGGVIPWTTNMKALEAKLDEFQPDIIHGHHPSARMDFHLDRMKRKYGVPVVDTIHMSVGSKKYFIDKVMHTVFMLDMPYCKEVDCFVAISKFVRNQLIELGLPKEKIVLLYAGVNPEIYKPLPRERHDTLEICFIGQMTPEKGADMLIKAVHELSATRKVRLSLVGNGTHANVWRKWTKDWPEINWVGFLNSPAKVAEFYAKSDVCVLPTRWDEAFSYIPLESLSCGTPVIASAVGGNLEAIQSGQTGFHFERGDGKALYEILKNVEIERLWDMGAKGAEYCAKKHTLETFGRKYQALYENLKRDPAHLAPVEDGE
jgi:glycosyltransferase involved in cell wall biosynthesis